MSMRIEIRKAFFPALLGVLPVLGVAQSKLSLDDALRLAKQRNGSVRSAYLNYKSSEEQVKQTFGLFFPTITPSYKLTSSKYDEYTGLPYVRTDATTYASQIAATWQLWDSGERGWAYRASKLTRDAERLNYLQTLRKTLFLVHSSYFDALRAKELLKIAEAEVARAEKVVDKAKEFEAKGEGARLDISQAEADFLNAKVNVLTARNRVKNAEASLKAVIGWDLSSPLPELETYAFPKEFSQLVDLQKVIDLGLAERPDLLSVRKAVEAQRFSVLRANQQAFANWSLDVSFVRTFSEDVSDSRIVSFSVSLPLFDGFRLRSAAKQAKIDLEASKSNLIQTERTVAAEIESAYYTLVQDIDRVEAARKALEAATENYNSVNDSYNLGASTIIDVLTAQVSLRTAESNYIEAIYDYYIADVQLRLAMGKEIPGEKS